MVLFILPVKTSMITFHYHDPGIADHLSEAMWLLLVLILEDTFSFEICENDREIVVNLRMKYQHQKSSFCCPNLLHIDTKQVERRTINLAILNGN